MQLILWLIFVLNIRTITSNKTKVITTRTGKVQGIIEPSSVAGKSVQRFINIPYAEPPIGKLRFSKPVPKKPWDGIVGNDTRDIACWQELTDPNIAYTEDCLFLNIWAPYPLKQNQSVMIWIHGGSFVLGRSGTYHGHNLVTVGDVILVTINYRLSVLGFLSTGDQRIRGNLGLFDQRLAMKWVKENIASFGGNPQSITIFGLSSGAACASAHTLSKKSWPYFNRIIAHSGGILMPWAITSKAALKQGLDKYLATTNCTDNEQLLECLRSNFGVEDLKRVYHSKPFILKDVWYGMHVDGDFFTDYPDKLWSNGLVKNSDIIFGLTREETLWWFLPLIQTTRNISVYNMKFHELIKERVKNSSTSQAVFNQAIQLYQPKCSHSFIQALRPILDLTTDSSFICATTHEATLRSQFLSSNVFLYLYSYASPLPSYWYPRGSYGFAVHVRDILPVFQKVINNPKYPSEDQILCVRMIIYITNFAKLGDPNVGITKLPVVVDQVNSLPYWPKFTNSSRKYLEMEDLSRMVVRNRLQENRCKFLKDPVAFTKNSYKPTTTSGAVAHIPPVETFLVIFLLHSVFILF